MSGANYEYCRFCDQKAWYVGDEDPPRGVEAVHTDCMHAALQNEFKNGIDGGSSAGWWDAATRAGMVVDELLCADAPELILQGAERVAEDLKETEHSPEGYKKFREDIARIAQSDVLNSVADEIDRGPTFPIPPSVISALIRERADSLTKTEGN